MNSNAAERAREHCAYRFMATALLPFWSARTALSPVAFAACKCLPNNASLVGSSSGCGEGFCTRLEDALGAGGRLSCAMEEASVAIERKEARPLATLAHNRCCRCNTRESCCILAVSTLTAPKCWALSSSELSPESCKATVLQVSENKLVSAILSSRVACADKGVARAGAVGSRNACFDGTRRSRPKSSNTCSAESHAARHELFLKSLSPTSDKRTSRTTRMRRSRSPPS
mmetsp:Transcript_65033/g.121144  ORF Transcript_65033/g.121144 Transcript_65033/m.121144 type:complete len:230 (+) Transcript_65033:707-1396(+)